MRGFQKGITLVLFLKVGSPRKYSSSVSFFGEFLGVLENQTLPSPFAIKSNSIEVPQYIVIIVL